MSMIDVIRTKYPEKVSAEIYDTQGNCKQIHLGFIMHEDSKSITVKTCVNGSTDEWDQITIPKNRSVIKRFLEL